MTLTAIRVPTYVHEKAIAVLRQYQRGHIRPVHIVCGNISLQVMRKWRLLSRDQGKSWTVLSHEKYNKLKDRKL